MNTNRGAESNKPEITEEIKAKWQRIVNLTSKTVKVPAVVLARYFEDSLEIITSSQNPENPFKQSGTYEVGKGSYCDAVFSEKKPLLISNALNDSQWSSSPGVEMGFIYYFGHPILWPDGEIFGSFCVLDYKENPAASENVELLEEFREIFENDLARIKYEKDIESLMGKLKDEHRIANESRSWFEEVFDRSPVALVHIDFSEVIGLLSGYMEEFDSFEKIVASAPEAIIHIAGQMKNVRVNNSTRVLFELSDDQNLDTALFRVFTESDTKQHINSFQAYLNNEKSYEYEAELYTLSGKKIFTVLRWTRMNGTADGSHPLLFSVTDVTEKKEALHKLGRSEEKFRKLSEFSPFAIGIFQDNQLQYFNREWQNVFGYDLNELEEIDPTKLVHPDFLDILKKRYNQRIKGDKIPARYEIKALSKSGEIIWLDFSSTIIEFNEKPAVLIAAIDITESYLNRQQIQKLSRTVDKSPISVLITDADGKIEYVNEKFYEITGYSPEEVIGKNPRIIKSGIHSKDFYRDMWSQLRRGGTWSGELYNKKKNGEYYWEQARISSLKNKAGDITHYIGFKEDITEAKKTREALKVSEEKYRALFEQAADAVLIVDLSNMKIVEANKKASEITGYSCDELRSMKIFDLEPECKVDEIPVISGDLKLKGSSSFERMMQTKNGELKEVDVSSNLVDLEGKKFSFDIVHDVSKRKKVEKELKIRNRELDDFVYRVSHDLKSPLNIIKGYSMMLEKKPEKLPEYSQKILKQTDDLLGFIDDLLHLSRAGMTVGTMTEVDLDLLLKRIFSVTEISGVDKELSIIKALPTIVCEPLGISQVFTNLIDNSVKYRNPDNEKVLIEVDFEKKEGNIILSFKDNGRGIEEGFAEKIFSPGFFLDRKKGTGFGLAIVKKIVAAHRGRVWAESEGIDKGAVFYIELPLNPL